MPLPAIQADLGVPATGVFDVATRDALRAKLTNRSAPKLSAADIAAAAAALDVSEKHIRAVAKVESGPAGSFGTSGMPIILYEPHVFARNSRQKFNASHPHISSLKWQRKLYGKTQDARYAQLFEACALNIDAAFAACSYGMFQVLGENWKKLGYLSAYNMAKNHVPSEAAQLDGLVRFVKNFGLTRKLRACKPGNPDSCIPFVTAYNGSEYYKNNYHIKLANALA